MRQRNIHRDSQTWRHIDIETEKHRDSQTWRHIDIETDRHKDRNTERDMKREAKKQRRIVCLARQ